MKDSLKQFIAFYRDFAKSIVAYFAERAARIEKRRAQEHARQLERMTKGVELVDKVLFVGAAIAVKAGRNIKITPRKH